MGLIPFTQKMMGVFAQAARNNGKLLNAAREVEIAWEGSRAILVDSDYPSFQMNLGDTKVSNEKPKGYVNLVTLVLPTDFRIYRQQLEAAKANGTFNDLIAEHLAIAISKTVKVVEHAMVHGYDLKTKSKITGIDEVYGCLDTAVASTNNTVEALTGENASSLTDYGKILEKLDDIEATHLFATQSHYNAVYTQENTKVSPTAAFNYQGINTDKLEVLSNKFVPAVPNNKAIVGNFNQLVWGVKPLTKGLEEVYDGNPRNKGELRDTNEVAFIFEVAYAWAVVEPAAFAIVKDSGAQG